ncbi:hypothetical protein OIO90_004806 [Microbotryomycetes sp. JL221]|nr:hypothetical protein OIO90_004806 [Microbotryomycetes sp. JL221]
MASRPRRSVQSSYAHLLKPIKFSDDEDDDSGTDDSNNDDSAARVDQRADTRQASNTKALQSGSRQPRHTRTHSGDHDETDVSEYGASAAEQDDQDESGDDLADDAVQSEASGGTDRVADGRYDDDIAVDDDDGHNSLMIGPSTASKNGRARAPSAMAPPPIPAVRSALHKRKRARLQGFAPNTRITSSLLAMTPQFEPPLRRLCPSVAGTDQLDCFATSTIVTEPAMDEARRSHVLECWTLTPFGPERDLVNDASWHKGKWTQAGLQKRWGGWFDDNSCASKKTSLLSRTQAARFMPNQVFPSIPATIDNLENAQKPVAGATEDDNDRDDDNDNGASDPAPTEDHSASAANGAIKLVIGQEGGRVDEALTLSTFESIRTGEWFSNSQLSFKPGHVLNAGGYISALDWCPQIDPRNSEQGLVVGSRNTQRPSMIQIWRLDTTGASLSPSTESLQGEQDKPSTKLRLALCIDAEVVDMKWCPKGGERTEDEQATGDLGVLACALTDGSLSLFAVPSPNNVSDDLEFIAVTAMLRLRVPETACVSLAWSSHERIAAGCDNGHVAIWDIAQSLQMSQEDALRPTFYLRANLASIRSICFLRTAPLSLKLDGSLDENAEPTTLLTAGYDGSSMILDLSDLAVPTTALHERGVLSAVAYAPQNNAFIYAEADGIVRIASVRPHEYLGTRAAAKLTGTVLSIATSDHHPFFVTGSADGACTMVNACRVSRRKAHRGHYAQTVFQLAFNRKTGHYHMHDNFHVSVAEGIEKLIKPGKSGKADSLSGAWSPGVGVTTVAWHPNLQRACLLASGTASGVVRIDWLEGGETV